MLRFVAPIALLLVLVLGNPSPATAAERPNVLLILADDMGWGDVRSHGNPDAETPHLDRLAANGARFDRFFVNPVCAPTRAALLTGRYPERTAAVGVTRGREAMRAGEVTLAERLRDAGYATGAFGKWHNGEPFPMDPQGQGFAHFTGFRGGHWTEYFDPTLLRDGRDAPTSGYITDVLTDAAIAFVEANRAGPFFCYVPYNAPHAPFQVPVAEFDRFRARGHDALEASVLGMVANLDANVGRLLAALDRLDLSRSTIVVFLTDNGPNTARFNGGMKGRKGSVDEGGVRVPMFVRYPGRVPAGTVVDRIAAHIDLVPTLLDLAHLPPAAGLDGRSLVPLLEGRAAGWPERRLFVHQFRHDQPLSPFPGAVRTDRYRLVRTGRGTALYDLRDDPGQARDLSRREPDTARELSAAYDSWWADVSRGIPGEPLPIPVGHPEAPAVELPAPAAALAGGLSYFGKSGWAHDWIAREGWSGTGAAASWRVDAAAPGRYEVALRYALKPGEEGATVRVAAGESVAEGTLREAHDPPVIRPTHDRVPRTEVGERAWREVSIGSLSLPEGVSTVVLTASPAGPESGAGPEVKAVVLRRRD
jgi:arylsulfatase A